MIQDEVLFTLQLATVVVDLHRRIGDSIAELCKVSYLVSAYCLRCDPMVVRCCLPIFPATR